MRIAIPRLVYMLYIDCIPRLVYCYASSIYMPRLACYFCNEFSSVKRKANNDNLGTLGILC